MKKAARFGASHEQSEGLSKLLTDSSLDDVGTVENIPMEQIDRDPNQPRKLSITVDQVRQRQPPTDPVALAEYHGIEDLAANIDFNGLLQPVALYRHGDRFRLCWGERRFLAHVYLGRETIKSNIYRTRPERPAYKQLAENLGRQDLELHETVAAMARAVADEPPKDGSQFANWCGLKRSQAFEYWSILRDPEVMDLIASRTITTVSLAARISRETRPELRQALIRGEATETVPAPLPVPAATPPKKVDRRGRPATSVKVELKGENLPLLARELCHRILGKDEFEKHFKGVDFSDLAIANDVVRQVINALAKKIETRAAK